MTQWPDCRSYPDVRRDAADSELIFRETPTVRVGIGVVIRPDMPRAAVLRRTKAVLALLPREYGDVQKVYSQAVVQAVDNRALVITLAHTWRPGNGWAPAWANAVQKSPERLRVVDLSFGQFELGDARVRLLYRGPDVAHPVATADLPYGALLPHDSLRDLPVFEFLESRRLSILKRFSLCDPQVWCREHTASRLYLDRWDVLDIVLTAHLERMSPQRGWPWYQTSTWPVDDLPAWGRATASFSESRDAVLYVTLRLDKGPPLKLWYSTNQGHLARVVAGWRWGLTCWLDARCLHWIPTAAWTTEMRAQTAKQDEQATAQLPAPDTATPPPRPCHSATTKLFASPKPNAKRPFATASRSSALATSSLNGETTKSQSSQAKASLPTLSKDEPASLPSTRPSSGPIVKKQIGPSPLRRHPSSGKKGLA